MKPHCLVLVRVVLTSLLLVIASNASSQPITTIDMPGNGSVSQPYWIAGWAVDTSVPTGTGVDAIHVYAYPNPGSNQSPLWLGAATYGVFRPDVGAALGHSRFNYSGYQLLSPKVPAGYYKLVVFAHSTAGSWNPNIRHISLAPVSPANNPVERQIILGRFLRIFNVNGVNKFLLFVSYFDAMRRAHEDGEAATLLDRDLAYIRGQGFDGIRIFTNWQH